MTLVKILDLSVPQFTLANGDNKRISYLIGLSEGFNKYINALCALGHSVVIHWLIHARV